MKIKHLQKIKPSLVVGIKLGSSDIWSDDV